MIVVLCVPWRVMHGGCIGCGLSHPSHLEKGAGGIEKVRARYVAG